MFARGYFALNPRGRIPVRVHWSLPLGAFFFTGFRLQPGALIGFVLLILLHELGHALLCRVYGLTIVSVDLHGLGGLCHYRGTPTELQRSVIAWGGVLAQGLLYVITWLTLRVLDAPPALFLWQLALVFLDTNVRLMVLNLLPVAPLDGAEAWRLPRLWWQRRRSGLSKAQAQRLYDRGVAVAPDHFPATRTAPPRDPAILQEMQRLINQAVAEAPEKKPPPSPLFFCARLRIIMLPFLKRTRVTILLPSVSLR